MSSLQLFLDEHISPDVAVGFQKQHPGAIIDSVLRWEGGCLAGCDDAALLAKAFSQKRTLVTYDQSTVVPLLKEWAELGIDHSGVIFIDERTIPPNDFGGIIRALGRLWREERSKDWTNQVVFLAKPRGGVS